MAKAEEKIGFLNSPEYNANMPEDEKKSNKIQKELISKLNRKLKKQKKILKESNKCGENPKTWEDYKEKWVVILKLFQILYQK